MQTKTAHYFSGKKFNIVQFSASYFLKSGSYPCICLWNKDLRNFIKKDNEGKNWQTSTILFLFRTMWMKSNLMIKKMNLLNKYIVSGICTDWFDKSLSKQQLSYPPCGFKPLASTL